MLVKNNKDSILYFIKSIWVDIAAIATYALVIGTLDHNTTLRQIIIPLPITGIMGTIVALLLAFRTAQSYDRWWEARKVWGEIVNDSRTLLRQVKQFLPEKGCENDLKEFAQRQTVWCYALSETLRKVSFSVKVYTYLEQNGITANNVPAELLNRHTDQLALVCRIHHLNDNKQVQIDTTIARLNDSMGKCERIKNTVFPKAYSLLIHFLIYVLVSILPFGLEDNYPVLEIVLTIIVASMLIGVEKTAIIMQDPFENSPTDVPMSALSAVIENNIKEICSDKAIPPLVADHYYYIN
ncbi:bestrophin family protein [Flavobacterium sp. NPDC079362]|uniref:Bestrophin, RFP-TM, chloride channel n=1 Tax=Flavobacterium collinsii TaxID=1114861 RepID=A0ABM8KHD4_9FLAO|nr:bestrophin family ion channel [Flavobacterium collinsii]CAA9197745.1 hypothetical protein FLACOL7796_01825 [Flavobacterium collinsii]